jgi:hypothetical protein
MEKIIWIDGLKKEILHAVKEERNILHTIKERKSNWTGHVLRRNCLLKHIMQEKIKEKSEVTGRRERRRKQLWMTLRKIEDTGN